MEVYLDAGHRWRWRRVAGNNEIVADSAQGYRWRSSVRRAARREAPDLPIRIVAH